MSLPSHLLEFVRHHLICVPFTASPLRVLLLRSDGISTVPLVRGLDERFSGRKGVNGSRRYVAAASSGQGKACLPSALIGGLL